MEALQSILMWLSFICFLIGVYAGLVFIAGSLVEDTVIGRKLKKGELVLVILFPILVLSAFIGIALPCIIIGTIYNMGDWATHSFAKK